VNIELLLVAGGFEEPVYLTAPPGDAARLFVVERTGRVRIVRGGTVLARPFLDLSERVSTLGSEQGLLSIAFHPEHASNGRFYASYTNTAGDTRIVRYTLSADPDVADAASGDTVLAVDQPYANHNGGLVAFGPDGYLYVGLGDGGAGGDPHGHGQNPGTLLGSLLRLDVDVATRYAVPGDNPFVRRTGARPEIWALGLRNPWRFSFDRGNGDLYIADVGQSAREEVSFEPGRSAGGRNYGWNIMEGSVCYSPRTGCATTGLTLPVYDYAHPEGCSITGGYVYRGSAYPALRGRYFFGDYCGGFIRSFVVVDGQAVGVQDHSRNAGLVPRLSSFGEDGVGELYVSSLSGSIWRITAP
jgi:glucose/arabinose dehydrogenase